MNAISKRLLSWLCVIAMVLTLAPVMDLSNFAVETQASSTVGSANLDAITNETEKATATAGVAVNYDNSDAAFATHLANATCPYCGSLASKGSNEQWQEYTSSSLSGNKNFSSLTATRHIYFASSFEFAKYIRTSGTSTGGTVCMWLKEGVTLTMTGGTASYIRPGGGGTFNIFGKGSITKSTGGYLFELHNNGTLNLYGGNFVYKNLTDSYATGAISFNHDTGKAGQANIYDEAVIGPETPDADAVYMNVYTGGKTGGTVNMYGGIIRNGVSGTANTSGGVHVLASTTFNMYGGTIEGGTYLSSVTAGSRRGGNLYAAGTVNIYGGTIQNGNCYRGGNVAVAGTSTFNMVGGTVKGGHGYEGGNIWSAGEPNIGGNALIADGDATTDGGNIYVYENTVTTFGTIAGGTATTAGGNIYVKSGTSLAVTGGTIVGDVVAATGATAVNLSNAPRIVTNETIKQTEYTADAGVQMSADSTLVDISGLTDGAQIAFTAAEGTVLTKTYDGVDAMVEAGYFSVTNEGFTVDVNDDNQLYVVEEKAPLPEEPTVPEKPVAANPGDADLSSLDDDEWAKMYKGNNYTNTDAYFTDTCLALDYCPVCGSLADLSDTEQWTALKADSATSRTAADKKYHYYFADGVSAIENITTTSAAEGTSICIWLNRNATITGTSGIRPAPGVTFNVFGSGTLTTSSTTLFDVRGTLNLYGGNFVSSGTNGAIYIQATGAEVNIYNGAAIGPETLDTTKAYMNMTYNSGKTGTINMYGGTIQNGVSNSRLISGNVYVTSGSKFNMYGGTISGGTNITDTTSAKCGGNLYMTSGAEANIYGGTITDGEADNGGNIYLATSTTTKFNMSGGKVTLGEATNGGNIYSSANITIGQYALIEDGIATNGGNIYINANSVTTSGTIRGGKAENRGGNIYVKAGTTLTVNGGVIANGQITDEDGTGKGWGGNIAAADSEVVINDGTIYGGSGSEGERNNNVAVRTDATTATTEPDAPKLTITGGTIVGNIGLSATETYTDENETEQTITGTQVAISGDAQIVTSKTIDGVPVTAQYGIYVGSGNEIDVTGLTAAANIYVTPGKAGIALTKGSDATALKDCFKLTEDDMFIKVMDRVIYAIGNTIYVVDEDGETEYFANNADALAAYVHGSDAYVVLDGEANLDKNVVINTVGKNLTLSGNAEITLVDTENKDFVGYGEVTITEGSKITFAKEYFLGNDHYVTIQDGEKLSAHYVEMKLTHITLRTIEDGLYYKVQIKCDDTLAGRVNTYGVVVDTEAMPTNLTGFSHYSTRTDFVQKMEANTVEATSLSVFGILKEIGEDERTDKQNYSCLDKDIYANLYLRINVTGEADGETYDVMGIQGRELGMSLLDAVKGINKAWATINATPEAREAMVDFVGKWNDAKKLTEAGKTAWEAATDNIRA